MGGAAAAIDAGFQQSQIERNAYRIAEEISSGQRTVVGVNAFTTEEAETYQPLRIDPEVERDQIDRLKRMRDRRDAKAVDLGAGCRRRSGFRLGQRPLPPEAGVDRRSHGRGDLRRAPPPVGNVRVDPPAVIRRSTWTRC